MDFLSENESEIIRNILEPGLFIPDSFETVHLGMDITLIAGQLRHQSLEQLSLNPGRVYVQGVKFRKPTWTVDGALDWLRENQKNFTKELESTQKNFNKMPKRIKGIEVFSTGKWNGEQFSEKDLDAMVSAFNKTKDHIPPFLKLGHDKNQKLLQASGLPSAGWVEKLYRVGDKLKADFRDIPAKIHALIDKGAYRKVSIELFSGIEILDQKFERMIGAIALLGADTPGVMNLDDILARYGLTGYDKEIKSFTDAAESSKIYEYNNIDNDKGGRMPEKNQDLIDAKAENKNLKDKLAAAEKQAADFKVSNDKASKDLDQATKDLDATRKEFSSTAEKLKTAEIDKQVAELESAKLCTPAMKPFMVQLLDSDKKEFSITKDKETKDCSRFEIIKETLNLAKASDVNFDNNSLDSEGKEGTGSVEKQEKAIEAYMDEHKVDFSTAYKSIMKDQKDVLDEDEQ